MSKYKDFFVVVVEKTTSSACLVGSRLKDVFQWKSQARVFTQSLHELEVETLAWFTTEKKEASSADNLTSVVRPRGR